MKKSIPFCSFGGYRAFSLWWWNDALWYLIGIKFKYGWRWGLPGWMHDIHTYWHRARYGWAARDTWSLDCYLNQVMAGALTHLAKHTHGSPAGYPAIGALVDGNETTDHEAWAADLKRWAKVFSEDPHDVDIYDRENGYKEHHAEETRRREAIHQALREIEPWWDALWD